MYEKEICPICGHKWMRRTPERPKKCPKCKKEYLGLLKKVKTVDHGKPNECDICGEQSGSFFLYEFENIKHCVKCWNAKGRKTP